MRNAPSFACLVLAFAASGCATYSPVLRRYIIEGRGSIADVRNDIADLESTMGLPRGKLVAEDVEKDAWTIADAQGKVAPLWRYLDLYPTGAHAREARSKIELLGKRSQSSVQTQPGTDFLPETDAATEKLEFERVKSVGRGQAWEMFIAEHPDSPFIEDAKSEYVRLVHELAEKFKSPSLASLADETISKSKRDSGPDTNSPEKGTEEFTRLRNEALQRLPRLKDYLCARALSRQILDNRRDRRAVAYLRARIRLILMSGIDAEPAGCSTATPAAQSAKNDLGVATFW